MCRRAKATSRNRALARAHPLAIDTTPGRFGKSGWWTARRHDRRACSFCRMEFAQAQGLEVAYARAGEGPPLVLVHGAVSDGRMWRPQMEALADEFTVIAWDEPGAGRSADLPDRFTLADYAECLAAVIEAVDLGPAHIAGLSWGGTVVLELFRLRPQLIGAAIFADTYAGWKGSLAPEEVEARLEGVRQQLAAPRESFDPTFPGLFSKAPSPDLAPLLEEIAAGVRPETLERQINVMAAADQRDVLATIAVPTLLIWGADDVRSPLAVAEQFKAAIPGSELVVIPDCGHMSNLEQPRAFNAAIREFCGANSRGRG